MLQVGTHYDDEPYLLSLLQREEIMGIAPESEHCADIVVINAKVWTGNPAQPYAESFAIRNGIFIAVGSNRDIQSLIGKITHVIDAMRMFITPGFTDSHLHLIEGGFRLNSVQLRDASTPDLFVSRIADYAKSAKSGKWITGGDWDHNLWGGNLPQKDWIDLVTPRHPVWVSRLDGHMALANSLALDLAGIDQTTPEVPGGTIVRNDDGSPQGVIKDNAMALVERFIPQPPANANEEAVRVASQYLVSNGVTSVHHMGTWDEMEILESLHRKNGLQLRISSAVPLPAWHKLSDKVKKEGPGDSWLRIASLKSFVDGSLGSHTAAFFEPYSDMPHDSGLFLNRLEDLEKWITVADKLKLQVIIHAIGDRAISELLTVYQHVIAKNGRRDRRLRIEHLQHVNQDILGKCRDLEIIASMQPYHLADDGCWAENVLGIARIPDMHAYRSIIRQKVKLIFGSDWYVSPPKPLLGIHAAVTRRTLDGKYPNGWTPEQKISAEEALKAYTVTPAYATFEETIKGTIEVGKLADFVVLTQDLLSISTDEINQVHVHSTYINGKQVF